MKRIVFAVTLMLMPAVASAGPLTFNLRAPSVEAIDEVNSFSLTLDSLTATLFALPPTFDGRNVVLNQTSSSFGLNVEGTTCGDAEDSAAIDGGCVGEMIKIVFNSDVMVNGLTVSRFGTSDGGLASYAGLDYAILATGAHSLGDAVLAAGSGLFVSYTAGNGFSLDNFTVTTVPTTVPVPEPRAVVLFALALFSVVLAGWRTPSTARD